MTQQELNDSQPLELTELTAILNRTDKEKPAKKDMQALREILKKYPNIWTITGDLAKNAESHFIREMQATAVMKESTKVGFEQMRQSLAHPQDSPLEELVIQNVVLAWIRLAYVEYSYTAVTNKGGSYESLNYWEKRLNAAQRRFLRASESLARIRKLNVPVMQVNIAQQQVNQVKG